jgi:branched-chain amino acid transport system ATP-binding protein
MKLFQERGFSNIIAPPRSELDLLDQYAVNQFFEAKRPEYAIICAAKVGGILFNNQYQADFLYENVALAAQGQSGSSFRFFRAAATEAALNANARAALAEVGLADRANIIAGALSHGEKRALEIAIALATQPKLLLLDEPLAGAGPEETEKLITLLRRLESRYAILLVEHDMQAVFALADRISVLAEGRIIASGSTAEIRASAEVRAAYLGEEELQC